MQDQDITHQGPSNVLVMPSNAPPMPINYHRGYESPLSAIDVAIAKAL